uniref:Sugar ABC transporter permease n=1 Tax=uncultured Bacillota bacterium TaxID=344338 RepID=A0A650END8_9FIRM|nr:sugar ABC transporter permease [uncultured Firmicutes bacterium]
MEKIQQGVMVSAPPKKRGFLREVKNNAPLFIMTLPGFILTILFAYFPMFGIIIAFKKMNFAAGILGSPWVGLSNFEFLFKSPDAWVITRNTILYNLVFIFGGLVINVALAIGLSELRTRWLSKTYQTMILMPHFLSYVIVSYLVFAFCSVENGFLNKTILPALGMEPITWYTNPAPWPFILIIVNFWKTMGYGSVVYLAAIAGIDTQLYEAAKIDGANRWQQIRNITIPSLTPLMVILTIMNVGKIFNSDFGLFYQVPLNSGPLYPVTNVINTYVYNMLTSAGSGSTGMASAASFYQSVVGFLLVITTNCVVKKIDPEKALF